MTALGSLMCAVCVNDGIQPDDPRAIVQIDGYSLCGQCAVGLKLPPWLKAAQEARRREREQADAAIG